MQLTSLTIFSKILLLSLLFLVTGCWHTNTGEIIFPSNYVAKAWIVPEKPEKYPVEFKKLDNGTYIDKQSTINLLKNIEEMKAYEEKLIVLIDEMKKYYKTK